MKLGFCYTTHFLTIAGLALAITAQTAKADDLPDLSAQWWQWGLSIPTAQNPQLDPKGENCMVGQRGPVWFLAGTFLGGTTTRACSMPANAALFFPVVNSVQINAPNVCGQGPLNISTKALRDAASAGLAGATFSVKLDGKSYDDHIVRIQSDVFAAALPADNIFNGPCGGGIGTVPAGIYSPSVDDGFYVYIESIGRGKHTLRIQAASSASGAIDVTYQLTVVPVLTH